MLHISLCRLGGRSALTRADTNAHNSLSKCSSRAGATCLCFAAVEKGSGRKQIILNELKRRNERATPRPNTDARVRTHGRVRSRKENYECAG